MDTISSSDSKCVFCKIIDGDTDVFANNDFVGPSYGVPHESDTLVAFPDGAPLTPGHTLVVPREHFLSFGKMDGRTQRNSLKKISEIKSTLEREYPESKFYYFEHGSCEQDEMAGCSTTHAHFHILQGEKNMFDEWDHKDDFTVYSNLLNAWQQMSGSDYYLLGDFDGKTYAHKIKEHSTLKCRMYLRKLFANLLDNPSLADYRRYTGEKASRDPLVLIPEKVSNILHYVDKDSSVSGNSSGLQTVIRTD